MEEARVQYFSFPFTVNLCMAMTINTVKATWVFLHFSNLMVAILCGGICLGKEVTILCVHDDRVYFL